MSLQPWRARTHVALKSQHFVVTEITPKSPSTGDIGSSAERVCAKFLPRWLPRQDAFWLVLRC